MKKLTYIISLAALIIAAASCQKEELNFVNPNPETAGSLVFTATLENTDATKTTIDKIEGSYKVKWESTDSISVNGVIYKAVPDGSNPAKATFTKMRSKDADPKEPFKVYYPASVYDSTAKKAVLPKTQIYQADGNIAGILPMYAEGSSLTLQFKNLCGLLKFNLKGTETVRYITVSDTSKAICGEFEVTDNKAVLKTGSTEHFLSLDCGNSGVTLNESTGKDFYVALPAGSYEHLAIEYTTTGGANVCRMKASTTAAIERNKVYAFNQTPVFSAADYLCFTCTSGNVAIAMTKKNKTSKSGTTYAPDISLLYYTDRTGWQDFKLGDGNGSDSTSISLTSGEKVYFRAKAANDSLAVSSSVYNYFTTTTTDNGKVDVSGNIMTLLNGDNPGTTLAHTNTFTSLFKGCTSIQNASGLSLPATSLVKNCYAHMFNGCTALEKAPALSATSLATYCYYNMFNGCTTLTTAPALPATSLTYNCYSRMFNGCSKLSSVTMLATDVSAKYCLYSWLKDAGTDPSVTSRKVIASTHFPEASKSILNGSVPTGTYAWTVEYNTIPGVFSVSATKKVRFSKGNLYWNGSAWKLESNQYDSPSTWNASHVGNLYWTKTAAVSYALLYKDETRTATDKFFCDGSDAAHTLTVDGQSGLYALSADEWTYLINTRTNASILMKKGVEVAGKSDCLIIAPDGYTETIATSYDAAAWSAAESQGLVCLPAAGYRYSADVYRVGGYGGYWSSAPAAEDKAYCLVFDSSKVSPAANDYRNNGYSIRLVSSAQ